VEQAEIVEVPLKELLNSGDPKWNVPVYPGDVVKVPPAGTVYVAGAVRSPGGFPLTDFDYISVIQAVAMAGGPTKTAKRSQTAIMRLDADGNRTEQQIDLGRILKGKDPDLMLGANDILFVPGSVGKAAALRSIEMAISMATGILIWGRY
jgi:polysaccharide export outer membrane protein